MKLKTLLTSIALALSLSSVAQANDINSSWSVRSLKGQAISQTVKKLKYKKFVIHKIQTQEVMSGQGFTKKYTIKNGRLLNYNSNYDPSLIY